MKRFFTYHPWMKFFSLLFACSLWLVIRAEKQREMSVNIPVRYQNLPAGALMTGEVPDMIRLKLRGTKMRMANMDDEFFAPYNINLEGAKMGLNTFRIYPEDFKVPFGVTIDRIQPQMLHITLSKTVIKPVSVEAKMTGNPMPGYILKSVQVNPSQIQIRGDESQLDTIKDLHTEEINLEGRSASFEGDFSVDIHGYRVNLLTPTVHVMVTIEEKTGSETILSVPIKWTEADGIWMKKTNAQTQPETVSVKITGPLSKVFELVKNPPSPMLSHKQLVSALKNRREAMIGLEMPEMDGVQFEVEPKTIKLIYGGKQ